MGKTRQRKKIQSSNVLIDDDDPQIIDKPQIQNIIDNNNGDKTNRFQKKKCIWLL